MRKTYRFALLAVAALATLGFASSAFASFSPKLVVSNTTSQSAGSGGSVRLGVVVNNADDPTARVQIYVPAGYQLASPAVGTKLGTVTATAAAADLGGAVLPLTGELDAIATNAAAAAQCGVSPSQTWDLHLTAAGQTLDIPLYVVAGSPAEVAAGYQTKLVVCLPPPDVPAGTPGRATFGAKLLSAQFDTSAISQPVATGDYRWTSLWTPYNPGKGTANAAGTVETQSIRNIPTQVKQTITKKKLTTFRTVRRHGKKVRIKVIRTQFKVAATVSSNGAAPASAAISTVVSGKRRGGATATFILAAGKSATVASVALVNHGSSVPTGQTPTTGDLFFADLGATACTPTAIFGGLPCADATNGGETITASKRVVGYTR